MPSSPNVCLTSELGDCAPADLIVFVTPSVALRAVASNLQAGLKNETAVLMSLHQRDRARLPVCG